MESIKEKILSSRERRRWLYIEDKLVGDVIMVCLKANIPGDNKNIQEAYMLLGLFYNLVVKDSSEHIFIDSDDGPLYFFLFEHKDGEKLKKRMMEIEDAHELGRFIDIDVYQKDHEFSRETPRKCYICDDIAFNCIVSKKHTLEETLSVIREKVNGYFYNEIQKMVFDSIKLELDLDPKFGLVTPKTNGSHPDMDYELMLKAAKTILPFIMEMYDLASSSDEIESIFPAIRKIGIKAENKMYETTNNVNAYKGLIFHMGLFVSAFAFLLYHHDYGWDVPDLASYLVSGILDELDQPGDSYGHEAYEKYGILGARGEAALGFTHVLEALEYLSDFSVEKRIETLAYLISEVEDTNLLKRSGSYDAYIENKEKFFALVKYKKSLVEELDEYCRDNNLSFGGSADLLIVTIFMKKLNTFYKLYE